MLLPPTQQDSAAWPPSTTPSGRSACWACCARWPSACRWVLTAAQGPVLLLLPYTVSMYSGSCTAVAAGFAGNVDRACVP